MKIVKENKMVCKDISRMRDIIRPTVFLLVFALGQPIISGCSAGGYLIGSALDKKNERGHDRPKYHADKFEPGESIRVIKTDSIVIKGKFAEISVEDDSAYAKRYEEGCGHFVELPNFPNLGDTVTVFTQTGRESTGGFFGYDVHFLEKFEARDIGRGSTREWPESAYLTLSLIPPSGSTPTRILLKDIDSISSASGNNVNAGIFRQASQAATIPLRSGIIVSTESAGIVTVPFDETERIVRSEKTNWRWVLFGIGLAVDAAAISFVITMSNWHMENPRGYDRW